MALELTDTDIGSKRDLWQKVEFAIAVIAVFLVGVRYHIDHGVTSSHVAAILLLPMWVPVLRRYRGAVGVMVSGVLAVMACYVLTMMAAVDHQVDMKLAVQIMVIMASVLAGLGLMLWAREKMDIKWIFVIYGIGLILARPENPELYYENPWKFGFSVPMTIILVGLLSSDKRPKLTVGLLMVFAALCTVTDARSNLSVLMVTIVLILWKLMPGVFSGRSTVLGTLGVLGAVAVAAYYGIEAAILDGVLGQATKERSMQQLNTAGSLLLGGRPELGASMALFKYRPIGFGGGTFVSSNDLLVAKNGMSTLHYDPQNGYVEKYMFGRGIELHSTFFDLWAWGGLLGALFALILTINVLYVLGYRLNTAPAASAIPVFAAVLTLWNLPFSPWLSAVPILILVLGTGMVRKEEDAPLRYGRATRLRRTTRPDYLAESGRER